jgi:hypothetical protein
MMLNISLSPINDQVVVVVVAAAAALGITAAVGKEEKN